MAGNGERGRPEGPTSGPVTGASPGATGPITAAGSCVCNVAGLVLLTKHTRQLRLYWKIWVSYLHGLDLKSKLSG